MLATRAEKGVKKGSGSFERAGTGGWPSARTYARSALGEGLDFGAEAVTAPDLLLTCVGAQVVNAGRSVCLRAAMRVAASPAECLSRHPDDRGRGPQRRPCNILGPPWWLPAA